MKTTEVPIGLIIVDETLYPRHKISGGNVARLQEALRAGAKLPPVVLDAVTKKVVDGWHRIEAVRRLYGEEAKITAELRSYASQQEMFIDAVALNDSQGLKLTGWDRVRSIMRLMELGAEEAKIRATLNITEEKLRKLMQRIANGPDGEKVALKGSMKGFGGTKLTPEQTRFNAGPAPGLNITAMLAQIVRALEAEAVDAEDPKIAELFGRIIELWEQVAA